MAIASDFSLGTVDVALTPQERFAEFLRTRGKRITQQRLIIVEHVSKQHEHFDADKLLADLRNTPEGAKASKATVYRTLGEMVDAGLLKEMELGRRKVYEHDYGYPARAPALYVLPEADRIFERRAHPDSRRRRRPASVSAAESPPDHHGDLRGLPQRPQQVAAPGQGVTPKREGSRWRPGWGGRPVPSAPGRR